MALYLLQSSLFLPALPELFFLSLRATAIQESQLI
jgi:hypothetical protein